MTTTNEVRVGQRRRGPSGLIYVIDYVLGCQVGIWFEGTDYRLAEWCPLADVATDEVVGCRLAHVRTT